MPEPKHIFQRSPPLLRLGLFVLVYAASSRLGMRITAPGDHVSAMWPASGVLLSALLLSRSRHWPVILLAGTFLVPFCYLPGKLPHLSAFIVSAGTSLEALTGAFILRRYAGFRHSLERVRDVLGLVVLSAIVSTVLSATPGVTFLAMRGRVPWESWAGQWRVFWVGDAMGVLLVAPLLLTWCTRGLEGWSRARLAELVALLLTLAVSVRLVFHLESSDISFYHPVTYLAFPFILWAALRFEARGVSAAMAVVASLALWETLAGNGPFALEPDAPHATSRSIIFLQSFLAAGSISGLLLAAALCERRTAQEKATQLNRELHQSLEELAAAQQALVHRERMAALGELSASVAHEVRNPLAAISNAVAALTRLASPEEGHGTVWELLGVMSEEVARLDHLIHGLLDFARPLEPRLYPQPLDSVVEEALESSLRSEPRAARVRVTRQLDLQLPHLPLDAQLLHLALSNLFTNALQAMPQGGELRVELRRERCGGRDVAALSITDTGPGISPEVMARMFEPFYTTKASGTGLGLPIVRRIVDAHQGCLEVRSTVGQGTTFIVHLPLGEPRRTAAAA